MRQFVAAETFGLAKPKNEAPGQYCSRVIDRGSGRGQAKVIGETPEGVPMASVFVRPLDTARPQEALLAEGERARRLGCPFKTEDLSVQESLSKLHVPKYQMGAATADLAVGTMFSLDPDVLDFGLLVHALNLFSSMDSDPRDMKDAPGRYVAAAEFQNPTKRARDEKLQKPPVLEMRTWSLRSVASNVKKTLVGPVFSTIQTLKLVKEVETLKAGVKKCSIAGEERQQQEMQRQLVEKLKALEALERGDASKHVLSKLIRRLGEKGISVAIFDDKEQRRTTPDPDREIIIGSADKAEPIFNTLLFRLEFQNVKESEVYLNECALGSDGRPRPKDTALHHIEHLRTDELDRVAGLFCQLEYPDMFESDRRKIVTEIQQYGRVAEADRQRYGRPLSEEAQRVFAVVEQYFSVNTILPRTAFRSNADWTREFKK